MLITPEYISALVNFYSNSIKPEWEYDPEGTDMRNLQVKGAAKAFNLLEKYKLALLADEVGMGKTIQSLALCAALWNQKPDAKILIIAPRDEIAKNWEREYQTFISHHYRHNDNSVKSAIGDEPIRKMIYCSNLYNLVNQVQQEWGQLFIGKISSFSSLMAGNKSLQRLQNLNIKGLARVTDLQSDPGVDLNNEVMRLIKKEIVNHTENNKPYFDLVIIDEAHYLRNKDSGSLKSNSAKIFFGDPGSSNYMPVSKRVLLLTATPNHSSSNDIRNIVSYFTARFNDCEYKEILDTICIRRLRRLGAKALNKYNYRLEMPSPSDFKEKPLSEMFFGLYQHDLAREINNNKNEKQKGRGRTGMMKYLEGLEFLPQENLPDEIDNEINEDDNKGNSSDYKSGSDARILSKLSKKYNDIFNTHPSHPKYEKLVEDLTQKHDSEKAVVFVRRIPSVMEISRRVIEIYDKRLWSVLQNGILEPLNYEKLDRRNFNRIIGQQSESLDILDDEKEEIDSVKNMPSSRVFNLFKVIKNDPIIHTAASNFRLRFNHSKPTIFSLFFSPGENYFDKPYKQFISYRYQVGKDELENFYNSALLHRANYLENKAVSKDVLSRLLNKNPIEEKEELKAETIPTLLTIFWEVLSADNLIPESIKELVITTYRDMFSCIEKEAFSNFLEKGTLLASEAVVIFLDIYRRQQLTESDSAINNYLFFCNSIKALLPELKLYKQIIESILHFKVIYTKVFSINNENELIDESWDSFNNAQPIYPYNADNKNHKVLKSFNTPFFPDMLVATSVLQEGVNLQYFCNTVYHYGMAWTPGDNEQRIGRIDRMFGKIERMIDQDKNSTLNIYYPYLKDTVDEEHLGRFAKRKFKEESLIDLGRAFEEAPDYAQEENEIGGWELFFRQPDSQSIFDPFPAEMINFSDIKTIKPLFKKIDIDEYFTSIINALEVLKEFKTEIYYIDKNKNKSILVDTTLEGSRNQPVIIELVLDNIGTSFSGTCVFCLRMRTPLSSSAQYKKVRDRFYQNKRIQELYTPGIKLCLDQTQSAGSNWGVYMVNELPLFITDLSNNPLSVEEIQQSYINLIRCADLTEKEIFEKDLKKEELNLPLFKSQDETVIGFRRSKKQIIEHNWKEVGDYYLLEVEYTGNDYYDFEKQSLIINHKNYYIKSVFKDQLWTFQVAYLIHDAQKEELELLEKHLDVLIKEMSWE